jgi:hypothetical protein
VVAANLKTNQLKINPMASTLRALTRQVSPLDSNISRKVPLPVPWASLQVFNHRIIKQIRS